MRGAGRSAVLGLVVLLATALAACSSSGPSSRPSASGSPAPTPSPAAPSFALPVTHPTVWVCRPGMASNPCESGLDATVIQTDGKQSVQPFTAARDPKIDCFYLYPTVSQAKTVAQPLKTEPSVIAVTKAQAARFQSVCRLFVPVYRQVTRAGLTGALTGHPIPPAVLTTGVADVVSAWHDYLDHDNHGRGVVLLGHSQGAGQLIGLLKREVDTSPAERSVLVSAIALGGNLLVPQGKDVGGDLQHIPACRSKTQLGCVVAYSSFANTPPANSFFGRAADSIRARSTSSSTPTAGMEVLCVNPADPGGGSAPLHPYLPTRALGGTSLVGQSKTSLPDYPTGFLALPGRVTGGCHDTGGASWLQITRTSQAGVFTLPQNLGPRWGLHLVDFNIAEGDLVDLVASQASAWK